MAPVEDSGGGGGPTYTSPSTEVSPANLESFAKYLDDLASNWADDGDSGYAKKLNDSTDGDDDWPKFGTFEVATTLASSYSETHGSMMTTAGQIHACLTGLATATRKIAENYKNAEALNGASVDKVEGLLDEHVDPGQGPADPGQGGDTGTDPTNGQDTGDENPE